MLAFPCPRCGRLAPLSLAKPDAFACAECGFAGAPPNEIARELHAAASLLGTFDARDRQITEAHKRRLASGATRAAVVALAAAVVAGLLYALFRLLAPPVAALAVGSGVAVWLATRTRALRRGLAAAFAAGRPVCRVCGETLTPAAGATLARCHYCAADNLVARHIAEAGVAGSLEARVARAASTPGR